VDAVSSTRGGDRAPACGDFPVVISDIYLDERTGLTFSRPRGAKPECAVILMTARGTMETVLAATRGGAFDYIAKPFELESHGRDREPPKPPGVGADRETRSRPKICRQSEADRALGRDVEIYKVVSRVAPTDATVLMEGETGTGKS